MIAPQELVERITAAADYEDCIVVVVDEWPMTEEQKQAVLTLDLNRAIAAGGNIYFLKAQEVEESKERLKESSARLEVLEYFGLTW